MRVVNVGLEPLPGVLFVIDRERRSYQGLSRDGSYWHAIRPARLDDPSVGDGLTQVGELICSCVAGRYGKPCYWTETAASREALEAQMAADADTPSWMPRRPVAPETELERAAARG